MKKFRALIIGNDINAYYLARCYHEFTGEKADLLSIIIPGEKPFAYTRYTKILNIKYVENLWDEKVFLSELDKYYEEKHRIRDTWREYETYTKIDVHPDSEGSKGGRPI